MYARLSLRLSGEMVGPDGDPALQLPQLVPVEKGFQLRLAAQYDLEKLVLGAFQVRQHAQVFQRFHRHVLGLVDEQHDRVVLFVLLDQVPVKPVDHLAGLAGSEGDPELQEDRL